MQTSRPPIAVAESWDGDSAHLAHRLWENLTSVILGKDASIRHALIALLSGGHLLIEDVSGVGKTLLAKSLAVSVGGTFRRIQATPDLLPSELTGVSVFQPGSQHWEFRPGPLFANVVLIDEINRATPRTQSALLEAMEENQVTVDGTTYDLPDPFFVVATQNPVEHTGTFPLGEGQRDRFAIVTALGLPPRAAERDLLLGKGGCPEWQRLCPVTEPNDIRDAIAATERLHCARTVADYLLDLIDATRQHQEVVLGASPRASLALLRASKAQAVLSGRGYVSPTDVKLVAPSVLAHRLLLPGGTDFRTTSRIVTDILERVPVPTE